LASEEVVLAVHGVINRNRLDIGVYTRSSLLKLALSRTISESGHYVSPFKPVSKLTSGEDSDPSDSDCLGWSAEK